MNNSGNNNGEQKKRRTDYRFSDQSSKGFRRRPKKCAADVLNSKEINHRNVALLKSFISPGGRILSARVNGLCQTKQALVRIMIKRARFMGLLPFCDRHR